MTQDKCLLMWPAILSISMLDTGNTFVKAASGLMMRPSDNLFFLMYSQTFLVTSVRGSVDLPQIAASSVLSFFGAKMPLPAFFWANALFLPVAFCAVLPRRRFSAVIFFNAA